MLSDNLEYLTDSDKEYHWSGRVTINRVIKGSMELNKASDGWVVSAHSAKFRSDVRTKKQKYRHSTAMSEVNPRNGDRKEDAVSITLCHSHQLRNGRKIALSMDFAGVEWEFLVPLDDTSEIC
jgi:hypothetical protein